MFVQGKIRDDLLELSVLLLELADPSQFGNPHSHVLPLPAVKGLLADADLPAYLADRRSGFRLPDGIGNLLLREPGLPHDILLPLRTAKISGIITSDMSGFRGEGQSEKVFGFRKRAYT